MLVAAFHLTACMNNTFLFISKQHASLCYMCGSPSGLVWGGKERGGLKKSCETYFGGGLMHLHCLPEKCGRNRSY